MVSEKQLRALIREELCQVIVSHHKRQLLEVNGDETGGGKLEVIKRGLAIAFPDWVDDIKALKIPSDKVDEFASLIQNAMKSAGVNKLAQAATASAKTTAAIT
jgi:hypothetical protein